MAGDALAVVKEAWDRWMAADMDGFLALWHQDGVLTMQGHSQISGERRGHDAIAKWAQTVFEVSGGTITARPLELAAGGPDSVLGCFHVEASRPGATIDQDGLQRIVVRDGKIASLHNLFTDVDEIDAFYK